jgi:dTDP-6-deoxy-L-talose 4-dehydrogenase (NAD+)
MIGKVLVTGGTGFIGRHVVKALLDSSLRIHLIVRSRSSIDSTIRNMVEVTETKDLFNESWAWWENVLNGTDAVVHLAWYVEKDYLTSPKNLECCIGTLRMVEVIKRSQVGHLVAIGTCLEYKPSLALLEVSDVVMPDTIYGVAKATTHRILQEQLECTRTKVAWCRVFYLNGEGVRDESLIQRLSYAFDTGEPMVVRNPEMVLDYMRVEDAARQISETLLGEKTETINICSGVGITVREIVENLRENSKFPDSVSYCTTGAKDNSVTRVGKPSLGLS